MEQLNAENILSRYRDVLLPGGEPIHPRSKYAAFAIMCDFTYKNIKFTRWSCALNCCSECPSIFVPDSEINCEEDVNLPFINFHHYGNISSCSLHKQILTEHGKYFPSCIDIIFFKKEKLKHGKFSY